MKIEFPQIEIIDDTAERLMCYINSSNGRKFNPSKIMSITAKNIISKCFGHEDYNILQSNLTWKPLQLSSLEEAEIVKLKNQYLKVLMDSFNISKELAEELWMASYPYEELDTSNKKLLIGQIGRYTYEWGQPDEYGEDTEYIDVFTYVIAVRCVKCKGTGRIVPYEYSYDDECDWCDRTGIFHKPDRKINKIRLTKRELELQHRRESYYKELEDKIRHSSNDNYPNMEQYPIYLDRTFAEEWGTDSEGDFPLDKDDEKD